MKLNKFLVAAFILLLSSQSQALFMPEGFQTNTDASETSNDIGC